MGALVKVLEPDRLVQNVVPCVHSSQPLIRLSCDDRLNSPSTRLWPSDFAAARSESNRRWARSATPTTTRCASPSSPRSSASCSTVGASRTSSSAARGLRLHRGLLQPAPHPLRTRLSLAGRVREEPPEGCLADERFNPSTKPGELQTLMRAAPGTRLSIRLVRGASIEIVLRAP